jgi:hypothetical protein
MMHIDATRKEESVWLMGDVEHACLCVALEIFGRQLSVASLHSIAKAETRMVEGLLKAERVPAIIEASAYGTFNRRPLSSTELARGGQVRAALSSCTCRLGRESEAASTASENSTAAGGGCPDTWLCVGGYARFRPTQICIKCSAIIS